MGLSVGNISSYLRRKGSSTGSMVLSSWDETEEIDESLDFPWNGKTCLVVLRYVMKFLPNSDHHHGTILSDTITRLDHLASEHGKLEWSRPNSDSETEIRNNGMLELKTEIAILYANSFIPKVQKFFRVPKLQQLPDKDKSREENEVLAGFLDFLLQTLYAEALIEDSDYEQLFAPLQKEIRFVLTFLGDIPFQCTQLQHVKAILAEFEIVSNETGTFIYDCFFATRPIKAARFYGARDSLLGLFGLLNEKIKEFCIKFSVIPRDVTAQVNAIDSLFKLILFLKILKT